MQQAPALPRKEEWECSICNITCPGPQAYDAHLQGKKHKATVENNRMRGPTSNQPGQSHPEAGWGNNPNNAPWPREGGKTKRDLRGSWGAPPPKRRKEGAPCELCGISCPDENALHQHLNGKKHQTVLRKREKELQKQQFCHDEGAKAANNARELSDQKLFRIHSSILPSEVQVERAFALVRGLTQAFEQYSQLPDSKFQYAKVIGSFAKGNMLKADCTTDLVAVYSGPVTEECLNSLCSYLEGAVEDSTMRAEPETAKIHAAQTKDDTTTASVIYLTWPSPEEIAAINRRNARERARREARENTEKKETDVKSMETEGAEANAEKPETNQGEQSTDTSTTESQMEETTETVDVPTLTSAPFASESINHVRWFEKISRSAQVMPSVCLMKHYRSTHPCWQAFTPWALEALVSKCASQPTLGGAVRRVFEVISAGSLLPSGMRLTNPCNSNEDLFSSLTDDQRLAITCDAQRSLNALCYGNWEDVFLCDPIDVFPVDEEAIRNPPKPVIQNNTTQQSSEPTTTATPATTDTNQTAS